MGPRNTSPIKSVYCQYDKTQNIPRLIPIMICSRIRNYESRQLQYGKRVSSYAIYSILLSSVIPKELGSLTKIPYETFGNLTPCSEQVFLR